MRKKGQAAMEFLMTYGWSILAAIIVIGVLAVYFRPSTLTTSNTIVTAPFYANAWNVDASDGGINLELQNNAGEDVTVTSITITGTGGANGRDCQWTGALVVSDVLQAFLIDQDVGAGSCAGFTAGEGYAGDITITYTKGGGSTALTSTGTISDTVIA